nr:PGR5-like protein 1A, chloroplastic [Tanacetum cinerariifolium]
MYMVLVLNVLKMGQRIYHQRNQEPGKQLKVKSLLSYFGRIAKYDSESHHHYVEYEDSDEKLVTLSKELIKFHVSLEEIKCLRLTCDLHCSETDYLDVNEMILLTANLDDCHDIEPGDIIWDKLTVGLFFFLDDITGFEITYLLELPEPFSFIFTWFAALPFLLWLSFTLTNVIVRDFLILKSKVSLSVCHYAQKYDRPNNISAFTLTTVLNHLH